MYTLIAIIFIAELIITYTVISLIMKADKKICDLNSCVKELIPLTDTFMRYACLQVAAVTNRINNLIELIKKQKQKAVNKLILFIAINSLLIFFRIKKIKTKKIMRLILAMVDIAADFATV